MSHLKYVLGNRTCGTLGSDEWKQWKSLEYKPELDIIIK